MVCCLQVFEGAGLREAITAEELGLLPNVHCRQEQEEMMPVCPPACQSAYLWLRALPDVLCYMDGCLFIEVGHLGPPSTACT